MATKTAELEGIGQVYLYKRRGARNIRLSIASNGRIRVSMPPWVPYSAGLAFVRQKQDWLQTQARPQLMLRDGMTIGKSHRLSFIRAGQTVSARLSRDGTIVVRVPAATKVENAEVQAAALKACVRALKREAEDILPGRLRDLAARHGFEYRSVSVKQLRSRWGSCNHRQEIVLNCYLMQLPWSLIDYVLLHELVHTRIMAHGPRFWTEMASYVDDLAAIRQEMRSHRPTIQAVLSEQ